MPIGFETANDDTTCLASAADRLRAVRLAHGRFLALWAADHLLAGGTTRLSADLSVTPDNRGGLIRGLFPRLGMDD